MAVLLLGPNRGQSSSTPADTVLVIGRAMVLLLILILTTALRTCQG
jgi:hypothetical protein